MITIKNGTQTPALAGQPLTAGAVMEPRNFFMRTMMVLVLGVFGLIFFSPSTAQAGPCDADTSLSHAKCVSKCNRSCTVDADIECVPDCAKATGKVKADPVKKKDPVVKKDPVKKKDPVVKKDPVKKKDPVVNLKKDPCTGDVNCPCYGNGSCNDELECVGKDESPPGVCKEPCDSPATRGDDGECHPPAAAPIAECDPAVLSPCDQEKRTVALVATVDEIKAGHADDRQLATDRYEALTKAVADSHQGCFPTLVYWILGLIVGLLLIVLFRLGRKANGFDNMKAEESNAFKAKVGEIGEALGTQLVAKLEAAQPQKHATSTLKSTRDDRGTALPQTIVKPPSDSAETKVRDGATNVVTKEVKDPLA